MNNHTRRLVNNQKLIILMNYLNRQIQNRRLLSDCLMFQQIRIFNHIVKLNFFIINSNLTSKNSFSKILLRISQKLFD